MRQPPSYKSKLVYSRSAPRRSYKILFWIALFVLLAAGSTYGLYYVARLPYWQIKNISVSGIKSLQKNEMQNAVAVYLSGRFFGVIPKTNYFFVRAGPLEKFLLVRFPRVRAVQVQKKFPDSLEVTLTERDIWALYCNDSWYAKEKNIGVVSDVASSTSLVAPENIKEPVRSCFFIDETGVIIDSALEYSGSLLPIFFDRRSEDPKLGDHVLSDGDMLFFNSAREEYRKNVGVDVVSFEKTDALPDDYILFFQEGWHLLVPRSADISLSAKNIKILFENVVKDGRNRLLYIDARFGNKMFFKLKQK